MNQDKEFLEDLMAKLLLKICGDAGELKCMASYIIAGYYLRRKKSETTSTGGRATPQLPQNEDLAEVQSQTATTEVTEPTVIHTRI